MDNFVITTENLTKRFGRKTAVDNLNLKVAQGSVFGFLGRNGAGKTTTIKMLMGLLESDSGGVSVLGLDPKRDDVMIKRKVGYVAENQKMYDWMTVGEIIRFTGSFYPTWDNDLTDDLCKRLELSRKDKLRNLSRGTYGKVALLLAMAHNPELLILDDATSGLDVMVRRDFLEGIVDLIHKGGKTVFFSSHMIDEVEGVADWVGVIEAGSLIVVEKMDDLKKSVKQIRMIFPNNPPKEIRTNGMLAVKTDRHEALVTVKGFNEETLNFLKTKYSPRSIDIIDLSLEDIFVALVGKRSTE
jgi:ABC-2 type transport system ATP-binding protein